MATAIHPIVFRDNHVFIEIEGALWVYDTGADTSFGNRPTGTDFGIPGSAYTPVRDLER